ncbi:hypothetical protein HY212_01085 [Candidatus Pacearchaeota archaeon]|nr:hypothetical protein [Candidatus Pacearchaeota archaeon]
MARYTRDIRTLEPEEYFKLKGEQTIGNFDSLYHELRDVVTAAYKTQDLETIRKANIFVGGLTKLVSVLMSEENGKPEPQTRTSYKTRGRSASRQKPRMGPKPILNFHRYYEARQKGNNDPQWFKDNYRIPNPRSLSGYARAYQMENE